MPLGTRGGVGSNAASQAPSRRQSSGATTTPHHAVAANQVPQRGTHTSLSRHDLPVGAPLGGLTDLLGGKGDKAIALVAAGGVVPHHNHPCHVPQVGKRLSQLLRAGQGRRGAPRWSAHGR
jgi:hypothetical protein